MDKVKVGLMGCGVVAFEHYLPALARMPKAELAAVCDQVEERGQKARALFKTPQVYTDLDAMLARSGVDMVVNTTPIQLHYETNLRVLQAGKHLYSEKPLCATVEQATTLIEEAKVRSLRLGSAAATMLNPVVQRIAQLLRAGAIGTVNYALAHNAHSGPEQILEFEWYSDPTWFYKKGSSPLFDLGVYGLHTLTGLLGPAKTVSASMGRSRPQRIVRTGPWKGKVIDVEVPDMALLTLDFGNDTLAFEDSGWAVRASKGPSLEIFGTDGTIVMNERGSAHPISLWRDDEQHNAWGWMEIDLPPSAPRWGLPMGAEHLIDCILDPAKPVITSGEHARHVIEIMSKAPLAAQEGRTIPLETKF